MTPANDAAPCARTSVLVAFELVVDLVRALRDQEQAADDQDQVAPGEVLAEQP